jgi:2-cysteine adaptor domain
MSDKYVKNPLTGHPILVGGPTYKKLKRQGHFFENEPFQKDPPKDISPKNLDRKLKAARELIETSNFAGRMECYGSSKSFLEQAKKKLEKIRNLVSARLGFRLREIRFFAKAKNLKELKYEFDKTERKLAKREMMSEDVLHSLLKHRKKILEEVKMYMEKLKVGGRRSR